MRPNSFRCIKGKGRLGCMQTNKLGALASVTDRVAATIKPDTRAIILLPLMLTLLVTFLHPAAADNGTPRRRKD